MMEISDYLLVPEISLDEVAYVKTAVEDHHRVFTTLNPNCYSDHKVSIRYSYALSYLTVS